MAFGIGEMAVSQQPCTSDFLARTNTGAGRRAVRQRNRELFRHDLFDVCLVDRRKLAGDTVTGATAGANAPTSVSQMFTERQIDHRGRARPRLGASPRCAFLPPLRW